MNRKLFFIKLLHTIIWVFLAAVIFYLLYAGIFDRVDIYALIAILLVAIEGLVLLLFGWRCPLTVLGEKYTDNKEVGFDIFLPKWLAKNNKTIFGVLYAIGVVIALLRLTVF